MRYSLHDKVKDPLNTPPLLYVRRDSDGLAHYIGASHPFTQLVQVIAVHPFTGNRKSFHPQGPVDLEITHDIPKLLRLSAGVSTKQVLAPPAVTPQQVHQLMKYCNARLFEVIPGNVLRIIVQTPVFIDSESAKTLHWHNRLEASDSSPSLRPEVVGHAFRRRYRRHTH
jgi:hypothetical protein